MARSILVNGWNIPVRLPDFDFAEAARNGEVATGGFDFDSENAAVDINSHWPIIVRDTDAPAPHRTFTGYIADKEVARGPFAVQSDRQFDVDIVDLNTLLIDDIMTGASANRPEETDIDRVTWLVGTSFLSGMGATIGGANPTTLEASDYRTQNPLSLLTQAAETAGKLFFVYWDFVTEAPKLFYDLATSSNFITSSKISTYLPDGSNSTTHHPRKDSLVRRFSGGRIYSELLFKYDGGSVTVTNTATASNYRARKTVIYDNTVKTSAMATRKANQYLNAVATPEDVITLDVDLTAAQVNEFRAGQLMQIKAPHLGLPTFVDRRIVRTSKRPRGDGDNVDQEDYRVTMELSVPKSIAFGARGVPTEVLPDDVTQGGGGQADTETTGCATAAMYHVERYSPDSIQTPTNSSGLDFTGGDVGSGVYNNVAWPVAGCPIGGGGWVGWVDEETWFQFIAPADDASFLGLSGAINLTATTLTGYAGGMELAFYGGPAGTVGLGATIGAAPMGGIVPFYIPRSLVNWGGTCSIIIRPSWHCVRGAFYCNDAASYISPYDDARGNSGLYETFSLVDNEVCATRFVAGTTGSSGWVAGLGDVDGVNAEFTLIDWSATGTVEASINGLVQPNSEVTLDTGAGTATLASPPPADSIVLFLYNVAA